MNHDYLTKELKATSIHRMLLSFVFIGIGLLIGLLYSSFGLLSPIGYLEPYNTHSSLNTIKVLVDDPIQRSLYSVQLRASIEDIVDAEIEYRIDDKPVANYLAVYVDRQYVMCLIPKDEYDKWYGEDYVFTGSFVKLDPEAKSLVLSDMVKQNISQKEAEQLVFDYAIDTRRSPFFWRTLLYLVMFGFVGGGLFVLAQGFARCLNVFFIPEVRNLSRYGQTHLVFSTVKDQFAQSYRFDSYIIGRKSTVVYLLNDWIVIKRPLKITILKSELLCWAYKMSQPNQNIQTIIAGGRHSIKLNHKESVQSIFGVERQIDHLLRAISQKFPHVVVGFTDAIESAWNNNTDLFLENAKVIIEQSGPIVPTSGDESGI